MKKWLKCLWSPLLLHHLLSIGTHLRAHGEFLPSDDRGRENLGLVYRWFCMIFKQYPKVDSWSTIVPFWDISDRQQWREIPSSKQNWEQCTWLFSLFGKRLGQTCDYTMIHGCGQWFSWTVRAQERTWLENWWQENLEKRYLNRHLWIDKKSEDICVLSECSIKGDLKRGRF